MIANKLAIVLALSSVALSVFAVVDESKPDLSAFKLKRVDYREAARRRASQPITELAAGAVHMHQSLFVRDPVVRCSAYAHLFKLIKASSSNEDKKVRQNAVEALAIMATAQRDLYHSLLLNGANSVSPGHFLEAANLLEWQTDLESKDTWLELIGCMHEFLSAAPEVADWLKEPQRTLSASQLERFKAVPVEANNDGVVGYLAGKIEGTGADLKHGHHLGGRFVSDDLFHKSQELVQSLDDEQLQAARQEAVSKPAAAPAPVEEPVKPVQPVEPKEVKKAEEPKEVELIVPAEEGSVEPYHHFDEVQLAILQFVKLRLQNAKSSRLSIQLALDFKSHWEDLKSIRLDPTTNVGKGAIHFLQDDSSAQVAQRIDAAIKQYDQIASTIAQIKSAEGCLSNLDQLGEPVEKLGKLLSEMDGAFDIDDVRRLYSVYTAKLQEYRTMEKFINSRR